MQARRNWPGAVVCAGVAAAGFLLPLAPSHAAPLKDSGSSAALRKACATGVLTPYACAQHGITPTGAAAPVAPKPSPAAAPTPAAAQPPPHEAEASAPSATPAAAAAEPSRSRRRRAVSDDGPAGRPFRDTKGQYDLQIPEGWDLKMQGDFVAFAHGDGWIQLRTTSGASPQVATAAGVDLLRGQYVDFQPGEDAAVTVGGRQGRRLVLSARSKAGRPSTITVVAAPISGATDLVVIAGGDPQDAAVIEQGISSILRTLHFR